MPAPSTSNESTSNYFHTTTGSFQGLINTALDYLTPTIPTPDRHSTPTSSTASPPPPHSLPSRLHAACHSPTSSLFGSIPITDFPQPAQQLIHTMRHTLDTTKHDLARANSDVVRLEERCRMLEKTLKETQGKLRAREAEIDRVRRERDGLERELGRERDRGSRERERRERESKSVSISPPPVSRTRDIHSRRSSLDIRSASSSAIKNGAQMNGNGNLSTSAPSTVYLNNAYPSSKKVDSSSSSSSSSSSASSSSNSSTSTTHPEHSTPVPTSSTLIITPTLSSTTPTPTSYLSTPATSITGTPTNPESLARLRSAETFLTRTDSWSGAQVLQAVQDINSEILQFAASATEVCSFSPRANPSSVSAITTTQPYTDTSARLGPGFAHILGTRDHSQDPILVQLALQACVCICLQRAMGGTTFCVGLPAKTDGVLGVIYRRVREFEPQPTSAKWRSLTHSHIHAIYPTLAAYAANELAETIMRWSFDILVLAGCTKIDPNGGSSPTSTRHPSPTKTRPPSSSSFSNPPSSPSNTRTKLTLPSLAPLLPLATHITARLTRLEHVSRQDILSTSFELVGAESGGRWVGGRMVDAFGEGPGSAGNGNMNMNMNKKNAKKQGYDQMRVLGCVEVGLVCRTRVGSGSGAGKSRNGVGLDDASNNGASGNGSSVNGYGGMNGNGAAAYNGYNGNGNGNGSSNGAGGGAGNGNGASGSAGYEDEERILLMPKVILESVVDVLDLR